MYKTVQREKRKPERRSRECKGGHDDKAAPEAPTLTCDVSPCRPEAVKLLVVLGPLF